jgi:hypothetical protein
MHLHPVIHNTSSSTGCLYSKEDIGRSDANTGGSHEIQGNGNCHSRESGNPAVVVGGEAELLEGRRGRDFTIALLLHPFRAVVSF